MRRFLRRRHQHRHRQARVVPKQMGCKIRSDRCIIQVQRLNEMSTRLLPRGTARVKLGDGVRRWKRRDGEVLERARRYGRDLLPVLNGLRRCFQAVAISPVLLTLLVLESEKEYKEKNEEKLTQEPHRINRDTIAADFKMTVRSS